MKPYSIMYLRYIGSDVWRKRRKRALARAGHRCQICSDRRFLQVHRNSYENLGNEKDEDLAVLCWFCHFVATWSIRIRRYWRSVWGM